MKLLKRKTKVQVKEAYLVALAEETIENKSLKTLVQENACLKKDNHCLYFSFGQFESLMQKLLQQPDFEEESLGKVQIAFVNKGKITTDDEVYVSDLRIRSDYVNILTVLEEALKTNPAFQRFSTSDKENYLSELRASWQSSMDREGSEINNELSPQDLEQQVKEGDAPRVPKTPSKPRSVVFDKVTPEEEGEASYEDYRASGTTPQQKFVPELTDTSAQKVRTQPNFNQPAEFFPMFPLKQGNSEIIRTLNEEVKKYNQDFSKANQKLETIRQSLVKMKLQKLEQSAFTALQEKLRGLDQRLVLKEELLSASKQSLAQRLQELEQTIQSEKQLQIDQARRAFDEKLAQIQSTFEETRRIKTTEERQKSLSKTQLEIKQMLEAEQNKLMQVRAEDLKKIEQAKQEVRGQVNRQLEELLAETLPELLQSIEQELSSKQRKLEQDFKKKVNQEKQDHLLKLLEETKTQRNSESQEVNALKEDLTQNRAVIDKLQLELSLLKEVKPQPTVIALPQPTNPNPKEAPQGAEKKKATNLQ